MFYNLFLKRDHIDPPNQLLCAEFFYLVGLLQAHVLSSARALVAHA